MTSQFDVERATNGFCGTSKACNASFWSPVMSGHESFDPDSSQHFCLSKSVHCRQGSISIIKTRTSIEVTVTSHDQIIRERVLPLVKMKFQTRPRQ